MQVLEVMDSAHMRWAEHDHNHKHSGRRKQNSAQAQNTIVGNTSGVPSTHLLSAASTEASALAQGLQVAVGAKSSESDDDDGEESQQEEDDKPPSAAQFGKDLKNRDAKSFQQHLQDLSGWLQKDKSAVSVLMNPTFPGDGPGRKLSFVSVAAQAGWDEGLNHLLKWDEERKDDAPRVDFNGDSKNNESSLSLAIDAGSANAVEFLVFKCNGKVSLTNRNSDGLTPLELAVQRDLPPYPLVSALLGGGSPLENGLAPLRRQLAQEASNLPKLLDRWPFGKEKGDAMDGMRALVPDGIRPLDVEREVAGENPFTWILMYKMRVMNSLASRVPCDSTETAHVSDILAAHGYDGFIRSFSISVVVFALVLGFFGLCTFIGFRLKLYGPLEAPVSLAEHIPGAFDPARVLDDDFDPARQKGKLPYRSVKAYLAPQSSSCVFGLSSFCHAFFGVTSSWLLQFVRIPPEKDPYDEDYQSDDDEDQRSKVREACKARALSVRSAEISLRCLALPMVLIWLAWAAGRWHDAAVCLLLYVYHAWFSACAALSSEPAPVPEKVPDEMEGNVDSANVITGLFCVQYGPRWTRAVVSTRSTATLRRTSLNTRRRNRKQRQRTVGTESEPDSGGEEAGKLIWTKSEVTSFLGNYSGTPYSDRFQRAFLQSGLLHIKHRALLERLVVSMVTIAVLLLWLFRLRWLAGGMLYRAYSDRTPTQIIAAYGAPGTLMRCTALIMELLLLALSAERLHAACSLLHVAGLSLQQRCRALAFASDYGPQSSSSTQHGAVIDVKKAIQHVEEAQRCAEFAVELSSIRWSVLAEPVAVVYFCTLKLLVISLAFFCALYLKDFAPRVAQFSRTLDPALPLTIALCLSGPLLSVLLTAATANREVARQQQMLEEFTEEVLSRTPVGNDIDHVALRVKARESLQSSFTCWPWGRQLGLTEPGLIIGAFLLIIGMAFTSMGLPAAQTAAAAL